MKKIMTVAGELSPNKLGITMTHEHILCNIMKESGNFFNLLNDVELAAEEVAAYGDAGGRTIVDVTAEEVGRDPEGLKRISALSGVNIITTTGYYSLAVFPQYVFEMSTKELAAHMIDEVKNGIADTGIRPGIIGELKSGQTHVLPPEERVLRAAARTQNETGLAITLHSGFGRPAVNQFGVLREEGASLERVIVGHADLLWHRNIQKDLDYYQEILDAGAYLEFDLIGWEGFSPEAEKIKRLCLLLEKGHEDRLLLSSDFARTTFYHVYGGRGYDYVLRHFVPKLKEHGVSDAQVNAMLVENPKHILSF